MRFELLVALAVAAPAGVAAVVGDVPSDRAIVVPHALVSPVQEARLPALRAGRLIGFDVQEGDEVIVGQSLARIDAQEAEAKALAARRSHQAALAEAQSDLKVQASEHATRFAEMHRRLVAKVVAEMPRAITAVEREQTVVRHEQAVLQTELEREAMILAGHQAAIKEAEERLAEIDLAERSLLAPFAGVVVERLAKEHEWVQQGEPVLHLVRMETLRVEAFLDLEEASPAEVAGLPARLTAPVGSGRYEVFEGEVSFVSPALEADGAYRIRVEIQNRRDRGAWLLRPGMVGELSIATGEGPASEAGSLASTVNFEERDQEDVESRSISVEGPLEEPVEARESDHDAEKRTSTPTELRDIETPQAARLELSIDDEIVAALTDEAPTDAVAASGAAVAVERETGDDASR